MATSRIALTTAVAHRLVLALLTPLVNRAVTLALMGSLAGGGFIGAPSVYEFLMTPYSKLN